MLFALRAIRVIIKNSGDVLHRRSEYFKKLQAGFDPLSRKTGSNNYAKKTFGVDLTKVADAFTGAFAPKAQLAYC